MVVVKSDNRTMEVNMDNQETEAVGNQQLQEYNIQEERERLTQQLINSEELEQITNQIDVYQIETIVNFGGNVTEEISKCSDIILNNASMSQINDSEGMLKSLAKIMSKLDMKELDPNKNKGVLDKWFSSTKKKLDNLLAKYHTMGEEVDKIYVKLRQYEEEIKNSNKTLESIFETNVNYYNELVKYILAGEQGIKEIDDYISQKEAELQATGNSSIQFELTSLTQAKTLLEQRVQDLRIAENVALQSIPMLKTMAFSNMNLVRKIDSAFIITLPVFKQALAQAILLNRQRLQAESLAALDETTNEMLIKNAQNTAETSKAIASLTSSTSIKVETLENTWKTILQGIEDTKAIQEDARRKREEDKLRLNQIKNEMKSSQGISSRIESSQENRQENIRRIENRQEIESNTMHGQQLHGQISLNREEQRVKPVETTNTQNKQGGKRGMAINLVKGQKINLTKDKPALKKLVVGLGWDVNTYGTGAEFDLDASVFLLGSNGKVITDSDFVFYGNLKHSSNSVEHMGDNRTGEGDGDDEQIKIDLSLVPSNIERIAFTVTIYDAEKRRQNFGQVSNSFIHIVDEVTGEEILNYDLGEDFSIETAVVVGELYKHNNEWKFNAVGSGFQGGLRALCMNYGVDVE